jgi:myo-inositol-1(or 4)-monophosphatase
VSSEELLAWLVDAANDVRDAVNACDEWDRPGRRDGQFLVDLVADRAVCERLAPAGFAILSEESGYRAGGGDVTVVADPIDGSLNAVHGVPWFATSLCAFDAEGPAAAVVMDLAGGTRYEATRGGGATCDGLPISPSRCTQVEDAFVAYSGMPPRVPPWRASRALGSVALALCHVASGDIDAFVDYDDDYHHLWDYAGAALVCRESRTAIENASGRPFLSLDVERAAPCAAGTRVLLDALRPAPRTG